MANPFVHRSGRLLLLLAICAAHPRVEAAPDAGLPARAVDAGVNAKSAQLADALSREKSATASLAKQESSLLGRLAEFERQVSLEMRALHAAEGKLRISQTRLSASEAQVRAADAEVEAGMLALAPRLSARYRLGREGYVRFLLGSRSIAELLRRKRLYSALLEADLDALGALRFKALGASAARDELQAARDALAQSAAAEQERREALERQVAQQKTLLGSVQKEKGLHEQSVRELGEAARSLSERLHAIELLRAQKPRPIPPQAPTVPATGPGAVKEEEMVGTPIISNETVNAFAARKAAEHAASEAAAARVASSNATPSPASTAAPAPAPLAAPLATTEPAAHPAPVAKVDVAAPSAPAPGAAASAEAGVRAEEKALATASGTAERTGVAAQSAIAAPVPGKKIAMLEVEPAMRSQRGKLLFPVDAGRIETRFGRAKDPRFGTITLQRGLDIRAPEGTEVHAIHGGTVVHAGWFSGYGNLVILDHGEGLFSLFAHLATLTHAVGDQVARGEPIGTVGDTGSLKGAYLYFELRDGQKPLDPERWLSRMHKAALKK